MNKIIAIFLIAIALTLGFFTTCLLFGFGVCQPVTNYLGKVGLVVLETACGLLLYYSLQILIQRKTD